MRTVESFALGAPSSPLGWYATVAHTGTEYAILNVYAVSVDPSALPGYQVATTTQTVGPGQAANAAVSCGPGKVPLSGGEYTSTNNMRVVQTYPLGAPWSRPASVANEGTSNGTFDVDAMCVNSGAVPGYSLHVKANQPIDPG